ncbi:MAG: LysR family transcriptional regulator substrate-binding protein, partial [Planctomycetota bacterium]
LLRPTPVMPSRHPLTQLKRLSVKAIAKYELLNRPRNLPTAEINEAFEFAGAFVRPQQYEFRFAQTIRHYASMNLGIGIVAQPSGRRIKPMPRTVEYDLSHLFSQIPVDAMWLRGTRNHQQIQAFLKLVKGANDS